MGQPYSFPIKKNHNCKIQKTKKNEFFFFFFVFTKLCSPERSNSISLSLSLSLFKLQTLHTRSHQLHNHHQQQLQFLFIHFSPLNLTQINSLSHPPHFRTLIHTNHNALKSLSLNTTRILNATKRHGLWQNHPPYLIFPPRSHLLPPPQSTRSNLNHPSTNPTPTTTTSPKFNFLKNQTTSNPKPSPQKMGPAHYPHHLSPLPLPHHLHNLLSPPIFI